MGHKWEYRLQYMKSLSLLCNTLCGSALSIEGRMMVSFFLCTLKIFSEELRIFRIENGNHRVNEKVFHLSVFSILIQLWISSTRKSVKTLQHWCNFFTMTHHTGMYSRSPLSSCYQVHIMLGWCGINYVHKIWERSLPSYSLVESAFEWCCNCSPANLSRKYLDYESKRSEKAEIYPFIYSSHFYLTNTQQLSFDWTLENARSTDYYAVRKYFRGITDMHRTSYPWTCFEQLLLLINTYI